MSGSAISRRPPWRLVVGALSALLFAWGSHACRPAGNETAALRPAHVPAPPEKGGAPSAVPDDGQWPMPAKDYQSLRYSTLTDINRSTVGSLRVAWSYTTGILKGHEAAPIVADGMMFVVTPFPNVLYGFDLQHPGEPKWIYRPEPLPAAQGVACCDVVNRGAAYSHGRVYFNTLDDQTVAVDAKTGREVWRTKLGEVSRGETMTMAPLVVKDKVLVGNSGGEFGVRGWLTALDASTGRIAWRAYSTGPDTDVLIGPRFKPFYPHEHGKDLGVSTWPPGQWQIGGGTVWGWISYDPDLNLIYYGTANPGPWNAAQRPGDNKWTTTIFARDPDTGEAVWGYQVSPHDLFDHDAVNENVLFDISIDGRVRKVLAHPDRNGFLYLLDRETGEIVSAKPFSYVNSIKGIDLKTGRPQMVEEKKPVTGKVIRDICPPEAGGKDWQPSAYSPKTGLLYIPSQNLCQDFEGVEANYVEGTPYVGANVRMYAGPGGHRGEFIGWDPVAGGAVFTIKETFPVWSGALVTAGDVAFYGTMDGALKAVDARTGQLLWQYKTESGVIGQPVTYRGPDGRQYVAVLSGVGGWAGGIVSTGLDPNDTTAGGGFANAMKDLVAATKKGGKLYVFSLP